MAAGNPVKPGDTVLCQGTGEFPCSRCSSREPGARVIVTSSSDEKLTRVLKLGASDGINYKSNPDWEKEVVRLTRGRGADCIIENGGAGGRARSYQALGFGGKIALIGFLAGPGGDPNPYPLMMKGGSLQGVGVGSTKMFDDMNRAIEVNEIRPILDRVFQFDQAADAFRLLASGSFVGKIAITKAD